MYDEIAASPAVTASGPQGSAAVACGSAGTLAAAVAALRAGGNAVDAAIAAGFAAAVCEPTLSSLGGGGFLLVDEPGADPELLDFFVDVPGLGAPGRTPHVETRTVTFASGAQQVFHAGYGSVATPGCLAGYLHALQRWGTLPLRDIVQPAIDAARNGVILDPAQVEFIRVIGDILAITPHSAALYAPVLAGEAFRNLEYADLLESLADGHLLGARDPAFADPISEAMAEHGGLVTEQDLQGYEPRLRQPIELQMDAARIWTNPPPSFGGSIILDAVGTIAADSVGLDPADLWPRALAGLNAATRRQREKDLHQGSTQVIRGTTHVSVLDAQGRVAALSMSNGSGSGVVVEGISMNNMLGEEDLNPAHLTGDSPAPGTRMGSMMAPLILERADGSVLACGTGGSERIRSALTTVLLRMLDQGQSPAAAISAPRLHATEQLLEVEPGLPQSVLRSLREQPIPLREWPASDLYFGGVHAVMRNSDGTVAAIGDSRRGGAVAVVAP